MFRILFIGNKSSNVMTFRQPLFRRLLSMGCELSVICSDDLKKEEIASMGVSFFHVPFNNRSVSPFSMASMTRGFRKVIKLVKPDIVFTYMLKANLFGTYAAKKENIQRIMALNEGRGDAFGGRFITGAIKERLAILMHRRSFRSIEKVIVINHTDVKYFLDHKLCSKSQLVCIPGVGIDLNRFNFQPISTIPHRVIMVSRLIPNKGIFDFCKLAKYVKAKKPDFEFILVGPEQTIKRSDLSSYTNKGIVNYLGPKDDVRPFVLSSAVLVMLSTYLEGFGLVLAEAMALGRCTMAYENCGPNEVIDNGKNGYLFAPGDYKSMGDHIIKLVDDAPLFQSIVKAGRAKVEAMFDANKINDKLVGVILGKDMDND